MKNLKLLLCLFLMFANLPFYAQENAVREYITQKITGDTPKIDGKLNDACWSEGEWASDFIQWIPNEGANPSMPTEVKILYNDQSIFVALRAIDYEPDKMVIKGSRRDQLRNNFV